MRPKICALIFGVVCVVNVAETDGQELLSNRGFEDIEIGTALGGNLSFSGFGEWDIDRADIVGTSGGVVPAEGSQMLEMKAGAVSTDVYQLVDLRGFESVIRSRLLILKFRSKVAATGETNFGMGMRFFRELPFPLDTEDFSSRIGARAVTVLPADGWVPMSLEFRPPTDARYVAVGIFGGNVEGVSKFVDDVSLIAEEADTPPQNLSKLVKFSLGQRIPGGKLFRFQWEPFEGTIVLEHSGDQRMRSWQIFASIDAQEGIYEFVATDPRGFYRLRW
ncbi:MAG: hypothetical protein R3F11_14275 [Verrucomicrobiales bacterium]